MIRFPTLSQSLTASLTLSHTPQIQASHSIYCLYCTSFVLRNFLSVFLFNMVPSAHWFFTPV